MASKIFDISEIEKEKYAEFKSGLGEETCWVFLSTLAIVFFMCTMAMIPTLSFHWIISVILSVIYGLSSGFIASLLFIVTLANFAEDDFFL